MLGDAGLDFSCSKFEHVAILGTCWILILRETFFSSITRTVWTSYGTSIYYCNAAGAYENRQKWQIFLIFFAYLCVKMGPDRIRTSISWIFRYTLKVDAAIRCHLSFFFFFFVHSKTLARLKHGGAKDTQRIGGSNGFWLERTLRGQALLLFSHLTKALLSGTFVTVTKIFLGFIRLLFLHLSRFHLVTGIRLSLFRSTPLHFGLTS